MPVENMEHPALPLASARLLQANSNTELQFLGSDHFLNLYF